MKWQHSETNLKAGDSSYYGYLPGLKGTPAIDPYYLDRARKGPNIGDVVNVGVTKTGIPEPRPWLIEPGPAKIEEYNSLRKRVSDLKQSLNEQIQEPATFRKTYAQAFAQEYTSSPFLSRSDRGDIEKMRERLPAGDRPLGADVQYSAAKLERNGLPNFAAMSEEQVLKYFNSDKDLYIKNKNFADLDRVLQSINSGNLKTGLLRKNLLKRLIAAGYAKDAEDELAPGSTGPKDFSLKMAAEGAAALYYDFSPKDFKFVFELEKNYTDSATVSLLAGAVTQMSGKDKLKYSTELREYMNEKPGRPSDSTRAEAYAQIKRALDEAALNAKSKK